MGLTVLLWAALLGAPAQDVGAIRTRLEQFRKRHQVPGLWVAASHEGKIVFSAALGRKWVRGELANSNDVVSIGSISKFFTADLILILISEGKLKLATRVDEVLTEATGSPSFRATVAEVLEHRGGFPRDHIPWLADPNDHESRVAWRRSQFMSLGGGQAFDSRGYRAPDSGSSPGAAQTYSNLGYSILGSLAERIAEKPLERVFKEKLFDPFGLRSAGFGLPNPSGADASEVLGHSDQAADGAWKPYTNWIENAEPRSMVASSSGGLHMTILDLCRYMTWRCLGQQASNAPYPKSVMASLWRESEVVDSGSGAVGGYRAWYRLDRKRQLVVTYVANANLNNTQTKEIEDYLSSL